MLLGFDKYLPKYKQGPEAVIVNTSSVAGLNGSGAIPIYSAVKSAVSSTVKSWGNPEFYDETKVRVVGICPGITNTPILTKGERLGPRYINLLKHLVNLPRQE